MGRGNACTNGAYEGLYYVRWDNFSDEYEDEDGNIITDYDFQREEWELALDEFISDFTSKYKSFYRCEEWLNREEKAILENSLFYIAVEDTGWAVAIKLIQKEELYYSKGNIVNLQKGLYLKYLNGIKECLFNQFDELGIYDGAWTSGTIKKAI